MFSQIGPAETTNYMILGFAIIFGVLFLHLASFALRNRNSRVDLELLGKPERKKPKKRPAKRKKNRR